MLEVTEFRSNFQSAKNQTDLEILNNHFQIVVR